MLDWLLIAIVTTAPAGHDVTVGRAPQPAQVIVRRVASEKQCVMAYALLQQAGLDVRCVGPNGEIVMADAVPVEGK